MAYQLWGKDGFDSDAEKYHLDGTAERGYKPEYGTLTEAKIAAYLRLMELDAMQPDAGGQAGIQDRVYIRHPDGHFERVT